MTSISNADVWSLLCAALPAAPTVGLILWQGKRIVNRLDRINGTVGKHSVALAHLEERATQQEKLCQVRHENIGGGST